MRVRQGLLTAFGNAIGESIKDEMSKEPATKVLEAPAPLTPRNVEPIDVSDMQTVSMPKLADWGTPDGAKVSSNSNAAFGWDSGDTTARREALARMKLQLDEVNRPGF